jgi:Met-zincin
MRASQLHSPANINDKVLTERMGLTASVMDYPAVNLASDKARQGQYFTTKPGPYDHWAIEYGYATALDDETAEKTRLQTLLSKSNQPELAFGNDADDMREPGKAIDPRVMIGDMSSDAIGYSSERLKLLTGLLANLKNSFGQPNQSYQELKLKFNIITNAMMEAANVTSRYIGGVYVERAFAKTLENNPNARPFTPVSFSDQKRAMMVLAQQVFSPAALLPPADLYTWLQTQRRGFNFSGTTEDPKITDRVFNIQKSVLDHILHPATLKRITDSEIYGNRYKLPDMFTDLTLAIYRDDITTPVNPFRLNLQQEYLNRLIAMAGLEEGKKPEVHFAAQAVALYQLRAIKGLLGKSIAADVTTKAHRDLLLYKISHAINGDHTVVKETVVREEGGAYGPVARGYYRKAKGRSGKKRRRR